MSNVYSMLLVWQEPRTSVLNLWHVYTVVPWCVEGDQFRVLVLLHLIGAWKCIYRKGLSFASFVGLVVYPWLRLWCSIWCVCDVGNIWCSCIWFRSEIFCHITLCGSTSRMECRSIMVGGSEYLNFGLPFVWKFYQSGEAVSCFVLNSCYPFEGDVIWCKFQPPSVYFVIGILSIEKSCQWFVVIVYDNVSSLEVFFYFLTA